MNKQILLLIFLFIASFGAAQNDFIRPFKLGSYYEWIWSDATYTSRYSAKIVSEEIRNGLLYQKMDVYNEPPMTIYSDYFAFDTTSLKLYGYVTGCPDSMGNILLVDFESPVGYQWNDCPIGTYFRSTLIDKQSLTNIFGTNDTLLYVVRRDTIGGPIEGKITYVYLEKFGYFYFYSGHGSPLGGGAYEKSLVGAVIDGVTYGSILLDVHQISNVVPQDYTLDQNYPNPFNPATIIKFSLKKSTNVSLIIYDQLGREIQTLVSERKSAGTYQYLFNANGLSNGIYFYSLKTDNFNDTKKMILLK